MFISVQSKKDLGMWMLWLPKRNGVFLRGALHFVFGKVSLTPCIKLFERLTRCRWYNIHHQSLLRENMTKTNISVHFSVVGESIKTDTLRMTTSEDRYPCKLSYLEAFVWGSIYLKYNSSSFLLHLIGLKSKKLNVILT